MRKFVPLAAAAALATTGAVVLATTASSSAAEEAEAPPSIVEDYTHPGAENILAQHGLKVFKGDGHIVFDRAIQYNDEGTECPAGLFQVEKNLTVDPFGVYYCFKTIGTKGFLTLEVPGTFGVRGGSEQVTATAKLPDGTTLPPYEVDPSERVPIEPGTGNEAPKAILLEIRMS